MTRDASQPEPLTVREQHEEEAAGQRAYKLWTADGARHWNGTEIPFARGFEAGASWQREQDETELRRLRARIERLFEGAGMARDFYERELRRLRVMKARAESVERGLITLPPSAGVPVVKTALDFILHGPGIDGGEGREE